RVLGNLKAVGGDGSSLVTEAQRAQNAAEEASAEAAENPAILSLATNVFLDFLGASKLSKKEHLPLIDESDPDFLKKLPPIITDETRQISQERFYWSKTLKESTHNHDALMRMVRHAKSFSNTYVAGSQQLVNLISLPDLTSKFATKFEYLRRISRGRGKQELTSAGGEQTVGKMNNRRKGKFEARVRKFTALPEGDSYKTNGYAQALYMNLMSDDEDTFREDGTLNEEYYTSCSAVWESQRLREFKAYLDKRPDTIHKSKQPIPREKGPAKEKPIPKTLSFKGRVQRWMVDETWWEDVGKAEYDLPLYVADNGKAWGEEDDPEEVMEKAKTLGEEKKKRKLDNGGKASGRSGKKRK
ncbi:hypothetical protein EST38_g14609, partial [Candolleomyces aberdarensis]